MRFAIDNLGLVDKWCGYRRTHISSIGTELTRLADGQSRTTEDVADVDARSPHWSKQVHAAL